MKLDFLYEGTSFSMRKLMAFGSSMTFFTSCVWTMILKSGTLSPEQYGIISGVFIFYFGKTILENIRITKKNEQS